MIQMKVATRAGVTSSLEAAITSERTDRRGQRNALHKATTKALPSAYITRLAIPNQELPSCPQTCYHLSACNSPCFHKQLHQSFNAFTHNHDAAYSNSQKRPHKARRHHALHRYSRRIQSPTDTHNTCLRPRNHHRRLQRPTTTPTRRTPCTTHSSRSSTLRCILTRSTPTRLHSAPHHD